MGSWGLHTKRILTVLSSCGRPERDCVCFFGGRVWREVGFFPVSHTASACRSRAGLPGKAVGGTWPWGVFWHGAARPDHVRACVSRGGPAMCGHGGPGREEGNVGSAWQAMLPLEPPQTQGTDGFLPSSDRRQFLERLLGVGNAETGGCRCRGCCPGPREVASLRPGVEEGSAERATPETSRNPVPGACRSWRRAMCLCTRRFSEVPQVRGNFGGVGTLLGPLPHRLPSWKAGFGRGGPCGALG